MVVSSSFIIQVLDCTHQRVGICKLNESELVSPSRFYVLYYEDVRDSAMLMKKRF